jgi:isopentenyldiphosphate isomerase
LSTDELVDWIDSDGVVIEVVTRARMRAERLRHRAVFIVVRSSRGEVLVHQRAFTKDLWPGFWDICVGGVVGAGEDVTEAAIREVAEEIGAEIDHRDLLRLGSYSYDDDDVSLVGECFEVTHDGPFHFADGEVIRAQFVSVAALQQLLWQHSWVPDSLVLVGSHIGLPDPSA